MIKIRQTLEKTVTYFTDLMSTSESFLIMLILTIMGLFTLDQTLINVIISVFTMLVGLAVLVSTKRGEIALHLKLDELIEANEDLTNEAVGAEHETTEVLQEIKKEVEERC